MMKSSSGGSTAAETFSEERQCSFVSTKCPTTTVESRVPDQQALLSSGTVATTQTSSVLTIES
jgi:hypothetical protein